MKRMYLILPVVAVAGVAVFFFRHRGSDLPVATGSAEGRASSRPFEGSSSPIAPPPQSVGPQTSPEEREGPVTATAQITRGDGSVIETKSLDGEFVRVQVEPNEVLKLRLVLARFDPNREVRLRADNGGCLIGGCNQLVITPTADNPDIRFQFDVGAFRGKCTVVATQGRRKELLTFWVGADLPVGQPGPHREFNRGRT